MAGSFFMRNGLCAPSKPRPRSLSAPFSAPGLISPLRPRFLSSPSSLRLFSRLRLSPRGWRVRPRAVAQVRFLSASSQAGLALPVARRSPVPPNHLLPHPTPPISQPWGSQPLSVGSLLPFARSPDQCLQPFGQDCFAAGRKKPVIPKSAIFYWRLYAP